PQDEQLVHAGGGLLHRFAVGARVFQGDGRRRRRAFQAAARFRGERVGRDSRRQHTQQAALQQQRRRQQGGSVQRGGQRLGGGVQRGVGGGVLHQQARQPRADEHVLCGRVGVNGQRFQRGRRHRSA